MHRRHNEDTYLIDDELGLYVVADGVGGHSKGEVASQEAVEELHNWMLRHRDLIADYRAKPRKELFFRLRRVVESSVQSACYMVHSMAEFEPSKRGMSTTISMLLVCGRSVFVAQVGDSRVYQLRGGKATQVTEDHTLINYKLKQGLITPEEAKQASGKNVITRAVGHFDYVQVDVTDIRLKAGDRYLLCSDGLHGYLLPGEVEQYVRSSLPDSCTALIELANQRGGRDNITVVIVEV